jgi:polyferredoxin
MSHKLPPQLPRYLVQACYLIFFLGIGWRFVHWVDLLAAGLDPGYPRPSAIDGFLPISGLAGLRYWLQSGELFPVHPAAALILLAALLSGLLLKRGFCSWVCPVFPISEGLWRLGRRLFGRNFAPPFWLDLPLRGLKYLLLGFFLVEVGWMMPLPALRAFLASNYHVIADVRLLEFFRHPSLLLSIILLLLALLCLLVQMAWCRYLCPYGALLGLASLLSLGKIGRAENLCIRCGLCSARCPAWLPVRDRKVIRSPECYACYRCVHNCPAPGAVTFRFLQRRALPSWLFALLLVGLFLGVATIGRFTGHWTGRVPDSAIMRLLGMP